MLKRYQVFVSSTYKDLYQEREEVMRALLEMDCIPAGMELFPATSEEQLRYIKKVIDYSDYYLIIIGGRYGSETPEGVSYTEREFDYAVEKRIPIIGFIHRDPDSLPVNRSDIDNKFRMKLDRFRTKVETGRIVRYWDNPHKLAGMVTGSVSAAIRDIPAVGWIRGGVSEVIPPTEAIPITDRLGPEKLEQTTSILQISDESKMVLKGFYEIGDRATIEVMAEYIGLNAIDLGYQISVLSKNGYLKQATASGGRQRPATYIITTAGMEYVRGRA